MDKSQAHLPSWSAHCSHPQSWYQRAAFPHNLCYTAISWWFTTTAHGRKNLGLSDLGSEEIHGFEIILNESHQIHMSKWQSINKKAFAVWQAKGQTPQKGWTRHTGLKGNERISSEAFASSLTNHQRPSRHLEAVSFVNFMMDLGRESAGKKKKICRKSVIFGLECLARSSHYTTFLPSLLRKKERKTNPHNSLVLYQHDTRPASPLFSPIIYTCISLPA